MQVSRKSWHFKIFNWFDKGKTPRIIDLCSYCRTIVLWAPLKAVSLYLFYKPIAWFYGRNKLSGYLVAFCLATGIAIILGLVIRGWFWPFVFVYIVFIIFFTALDESEAIRADLKKAKETKIGEYTVKGIQVIKNGLLGTIFWLLKIVFYTIWKKLYHLHQVLFWMVLTATVAGIWWGLIAFGVWWNVLSYIIAIAVVVIVIVGLLFLFGWIRNLNLNDNLAWQWLKAKKRKICPFIEVKN